MKIKFTFPIDGFEAGLVYDVPIDKALEYLANEQAIPADDSNLINVSVTSDAQPVYIEGRSRKVKHDTR